MTRCDLLDYYFNYAENLIEDWFIHDGAVMEVFDPMKWEGVAVDADPTFERLTLKAGKEWKLRLERHKPRDLGVETTSWLPHPTPAAVLLPGMGAVCRLTIGIVSQSLMSMRTCEPFSYMVGTSGIYGSSMWYSMYSYDLPLYVAMLVEEKYQDHQFGTATPLSPERHRALLLDWHEQFRRLRPEARLTI